MERMLFPCVDKSDAESVTSIVTRMGRDKKAEYQPSQAR